MPKPDRYVFVCANERPEGHPRGSCIGRGSGDLLARFRELQGEKGLTSFKAVATGCLEPCMAGPTVYVAPDDVWYGGVTEADVERIIDEHLVGGQPVAFLTLTREEFEDAQRGPKQS